MSNNNSNPSLPKAPNAPKTPEWKSSTNWRTGAPLSTPTTKQHLTSGGTSGPAASIIRPTVDASPMFKVRIERSDLKRKLQDSVEEQRHTKRQRKYMVVTDTLESPTIDRYKAEVAREADAAYEPACKIWLHNLLPQDDELVVRANIQAGDLIEQLTERVEEMREAINKLQKERKEAKALQQTAEEDEQLKISPKDQTYLMTRYLHHRFRTLWQIGRNTRRVPDQPLEEGEMDFKKIQLHQELFEDHKRFPGSDAIPWQRHKDRFDLASYLGHMGDLKADLLAGTSEYFTRWHGSDDIKLKNHAEVSKSVHERIFKKVYNLSFEEAKWLVDASENGRERLIEYASWALRLIQRSIYAIDFNYKNITSHTNEGPTGRKYHLDRNAAVYTTLRLLEGEYSRFTAKIKLLINNMKPAAADPTSVTQADIDHLRRLVNEYWKAVEPLVDPAKADSVEWYKWTAKGKSGSRMARFKPADVLQLSHDAGRWNETDF